MRFATRSKPKSAPGAPLETNLISLSGGFAFPACLPDVSEVVSDVARRCRTEVMQYSGTLGISDMRDTVAEYVGRDGVSCARENVLITNGAKHGLDLACRVFVDPGDTVIVTDPTYMTALQILRTFEVNWLTVGQDDDGIDLASLRAKLEARKAAGEPMPKLLFDVPDFHNPTGITTTAARRSEMVALAKEFDFVIVEDDPYRRIRFEGVSVPPIKSFDDADVVIAVGTVSKILAPGLRMGWAIASPEIIRRMAAQKADGGSSALLQRVCVELFRNGTVDHHVREISAALKIHRDAMIGAFAAHLPDVRVHKPEGGYYLWAELPGFMDSDLLAGLALRRGTEVYSGRMCYAEEPKTNFLRLCYSFVSPAEIAKGVSRLAQAYGEMNEALESNDRQGLVRVGRDMATY